MTQKHPITVAYGDGIGPEIMEAVLHVLKEAKAPLDIERVRIGEKVYRSGIETGMEPKTWESLRRTGIFLKAPITTPQGGGYRSLNVTVRTMLGLYANVRPCISYYPFIATKHSKMDVVIVRENEEDLYTGIEYRQSPDTTVAQKIISRPGTERICRYAFEYAIKMGRKKVACFTKDNILKITDGLFHKIFDEMGKEYPSLEKDHWIIDIGAARLADTPEIFDVIVMPNLYGDILSDVAAQITGSVGLVGTANIGEKGAMFEAIHGSAPDCAGKNVANPTGLLLAAVLMLVHLKETTLASSIHNAFLKTIEEGIHTQDISNPTNTKKCVGTKEFAKEIAKRLGQTPKTLKANHYSPEHQRAHLAHVDSKTTSTKRALVGVDVTLYSHDATSVLKEKIDSIDTPSLTLEAITNRGAKVYPGGIAETLCIDTFRCRFIGCQPLSYQMIASLLHRLADAELDVVKSDTLYTFDGIPGYSSI